MLPGSHTHDKKAGLAYWAQRVLEECDKASQDFAPDPVHDLRVAIRRCRSMADGFLSVDPDPEWKQMKKLGKPLFQQPGRAARHPSDGGMGGHGFLRITILFATYFCIRCRIRRPRKKRPLRKRCRASTASDGRR